MLQVQLEDGEIDDVEYAEREAELFARLRDIRARKRAEIDRAASGDEVEGEANVPETSVRARRRVVIETPFDE